MSKTRNRFSSEVRARAVRMVWITRPNTPRVGRIGCTAQMLRDLTEAEWRLLKDLLPPERGRNARPAHDNRAIVNGILWRIRGLPPISGPSRLTRSLPDFARMIEIFDRRPVSFVSVTQAFNTTTSMGRLTLNVLLSFAQFEREVMGERIRDKIAASMLVATVNFPFVTTQNFSLWACR